MRTFDSIGEGKCLICGTNKKGKCFLAGIDDTSDGSIEEGIPIHTDCLDNVRFNKKLNIIYIKLAQNMEG